MEKNHKWKLSDDIVAFYLYKYSSKTEIELAVKKLGIKVTSLKMRVNNFAFLATNKGLSNFSKQTESVFYSWEDSSLTELKSEYEKIITMIK
jgi:ligand-binding sensor domain-containing protein